PSRCPATAGSALPSSRLCGRRVSPRFGCPAQALEDLQEYREERCTGVSSWPMPSCSSPARRSRAARRGRLPRRRGRGLRRRRQQLAGRGAGGDGELPNPANLFVAAFIGSPSMNLVPSKAVAVGREGQIAGFRPEHLELGNGKADAMHLAPLVEAVEYLGDEQLAHLRLGDAPILAKLPVEQQLEEGRQEQFSVPLSKVLLFDAETERSLGTAA